MKNIKSHMEWAWIIIITFFSLSIIDYRFGILGFICMGAPIAHALMGKGKIHCIKYCPRGSFLGKMLQKISLGLKMPKFMKSKQFKNALLLLMLTMLSVALYHSGGDFNKIAFAMFRFMGVSFIFGILMGILFKPRSWCIVCPMGHATGQIKNIQVKIEKKKEKVYTSN